MRTENLKELEDDILDLVSDCSRCKMCVEVCPTYEGWYSQSAVGRLMAIYYHLKYGLGSDKELSDLLFACTVCRRCQARCKRMSAGAKSVDIIIKARNLLVKTSENKREAGS